MSKTVIVCVWSGGRGLHVWGVRAGMGLRLTSRCSGTATAIGARGTITLGSRAMVARRWAVEARIALRTMGPSFR